MTLSFQKILIFALAITFVFPYQFPSISAESVSVFPLILSALVILINRHDLKIYLWILFFSSFVIVLSASPLITDNATFCLMKLSDIRLAIFSSWLSFIVYLEFEDVRLHCLREFCCSGRLCGLPGQQLSIFH